MMSLEDRVERLEEESRQTRQLVTTCMQTAQNAVVAHEQNRVLLNALAEVQGSHTVRLNSIDGRLDRIDGRLDRVETRLDRVETHLREHDRRFDAIDRRFEAIDRRFEAIDRRFEAVDRRFDEVDKQLSDIRGTISKVAVGMYTLEKLIRRVAPADD